MSKGLSTAIGRAPVGAGSVGPSGHIVHSAHAAGPPMSTAPNRRRGQRRENAATDVSNLSLLKVASTTMADVNPITACQGRFGTPKNRITQETASRMDTSANVTVMVQRRGASSPTAHKTGQATPTKPMTSKSAISSAPTRGSNDASERGSLADSL